MKPAHHLSYHRMRYDDAVLRIMYDTVFERNKQVWDCTLNSLHGHKQRNILEG